ncbi:uncharacterized protein G2W53_033740 [Senna tora]|uniref:Uncharacterized protein n=1 Tax=Senna tora TaxID=362788 RepID=A0A834WD40_9FABA|nr:uncharacterized protein G2W53_033740 [Senna tora]
MMASARSPVTLVSDRRMTLGECLLAISRKTLRKLSLAAPLTFQIRILIDSIRKLLEEKFWPTMPLESEEERTAPPGRLPVILYWTSASNRLARNVWWFVSIGNSVTWLRECVCIAAGGNTSASPCIFSLCIVERVSSLQMTSHWLSNIRDAHCCSQGAWVWERVPVTIFPHWHQDWDLWFCKVPFPVEDLAAEVGSAPVQVRFVGFVGFELACGHASVVGFASPPVLGVERSSENGSVSVAHSGLGLVSAFPPLESVGRGAASLLSEVATALDIGFDERGVAVNLLFCFFFSFWAEGLICSCWGTVFSGLAGLVLRLFRRLTVVHSSSLPEEGFDTTIGICRGHAAVEWFDFPQPWQNPEIPSIVKLWLKPPMLRLGGGGLLRLRITQILAYLARSRLWVGRLSSLIHTGEKASERADVGLNLGSHVRTDKKWPSIKVMPWRRAFHRYSTQPNEIMKNPRPMLSNLVQFSHLAHNSFSSFSERGMKTLFMVPPLISMVAALGLWGDVETREGGITRASIVPKEIVLILPWVRVLTSFPPFSVTFDLMALLSFSSRTSSSSFCFSFTLSSSSTSSAQFVFRCFTSPTFAVVAIDASFVFVPSSVFAFCVFAMILSLSLFPLSIIPFIVEVIFMTFVV